MPVTTRRKQTAPCLLRPTSSIPDAFLSLESNEHGDRPLSLHRAQCRLFKDISSYLDHRQHGVETDDDVSAAEYILEWTQRTCRLRQRILEVDDTYSMEITPLITSLFESDWPLFQLQALCPDAEDEVLEKLWKHLECVFEVIMYDKALAEEGNSRVSRQYCGASLHGKRRRKNNAFKKPSYPHSPSSDFPPRYKSWYNCEEEVDKSDKKRMKRAALSPAPVIIKTEEVDRRDKKRTKRVALSPAPVITKTGEIDRVNTLSGPPSPSRDRIEAAEFHFWTTGKRYVGATRATMALLDGIEPGEGQFSETKSAALIPSEKVFKKTIKPELAAIVSQRIVDLVEKRMERA